MLNLEELLYPGTTDSPRSRTFLKEERRKFDRTRVERKVPHNYVSYVDKESEKWLIAQLPCFRSRLHRRRRQRQPDRRKLLLAGGSAGRDFQLYSRCRPCVSIALRNKEELLIGVVYEVCRDECFYAWKGSKAYLDGREIHVSDVSDLDKAFIDLGFPYNSDAYRPVPPPGRPVIRFRRRNAPDGSGGCRSLLYRRRTFRSAYRSLDRLPGYSGRRPDPDASRR